MTSENFEEIIQLIKDNIKRTPEQPSRGVLKKRCLQENNQAEM